MVIMDTSITGVALPEIQADLGFSPEDLSWVFNAYVIAFGGLLLLGGRLSDLLGAAWIPMWFFLNLYLQQVLGYGAFEGGAALLPMTAAIMLGMVIVAPRVIARYGVKPPVVAGMLLLAAGMAVMSLVRPDGSFLVDVLPASLIAAAGMSLAFIPSLGTAISSAKPQEGGLASGIVNTSYQVGSALGLAAMTAVAAANGAGQLGNLPALTSGFSSAFVGAAGIAVAGALLAAATLRSHRAAAAEPADEPATTRV
jgi:MFS family permease